MALGDPLYFLNGVRGLGAKHYRVYRNLNAWVEDALGCPLRVKIVERPIKDHSCEGTAGVLQVCGLWCTKLIACGIWSVHFVAYRGSREGAQAHRILVFVGGRGRVSQLLSLSIFFLKKDSSRVQNAQWLLEGEGVWHRCR